MEQKPQKTFTMNIDRLVSIGALILSLGAATFGVLSRQNNLEFLTKTEFAAFQIQNVQKMTSLESTISSGFMAVSQQISSLQFVPTKEFLDFKEKVTESNYELKKSVDFVKKDMEVLEKQVDGLDQSVSTQSARINLLTDAVVKGEIKK